MARRVISDEETEQVIADAVACRDDQRAELRVVARGTSDGGAIIMPVTIPASTARKLLAMAAERGLPLSEMLTVALEEHTHCSAEITRKSVPPLVLS